MIWTGRVLSGLCAALFCFSASFKFIQPAEVVEQMAKFGFKQELLLGIGIVELVCTLLYLIPRTAVLGAVLLTGYLGGATVTHLRVGDPYILPPIFGAVVWFGIWFRDARIRALLPLRA